MKRLDMAWSNAGIGAVYVVTIALCGGPATGGTWIEDRLPARPADPVDLYTVSGKMYWGGGIPCRLATEDEKALRLTTHPDELPWEIWDGRPYPRQA